MGGANMPFPVDPLVEMVRAEVPGALLAPGVTEAALKLQAALEGFPEQETFTPLLKAEFTDETVTVMVEVDCPLVTETLLGETDTEKSLGAAPTFATNASAGPPPYAFCIIGGNPVLLLVFPAK